MNQHFLHGTYFVKDNRVLNCVDSCVLVSESGINSLRKMLHQSEEIKVHFRHNLELML